MPSPAPAPHVKGRLSDSRVAVEQKQHTCGCSGLRRHANPATVVPAKAGTSNLGHRIFCYHKGVEDTELHRLSLRNSAPSAPLRLKKSLADVVKLKIEASERPISSFPRRREPQQAGVEIPAYAGMTVHVTTRPKFQREAAGRPPPTPSRAGPPGSGFPPDGGRCVRCSRQLPAG